MMEIAVKGGGVRNVMKYINYFLFLFRGTLPPSPHIVIEKKECH